MLHGASRTVLLVETKGIGAGMVWPVRTIVRQFIQLTCSNWRCPLLQFNSGRLAVVMVVKVQKRAQEP